MFSYHQGAEYKHQHHAEFESERIDEGRKRCGIWS